MNRIESAAPNEVVSQSSTPAESSRPATRWRTPLPFALAPKRPTRLGDPPRQLRANLARASRHEETPIHVEQEGRTTRPAPSSTIALVRLLQDSLRHGHWRVAVRRFRMLEAANMEIPDDLFGTCRALSEKMTAREMDAIERDALAWAMCLTMRREVRA